MPSPDQQNPFQSIPPSTVSGMTSAAVNDDTLLIDDGVKAELLSEGGVGGNGGGLERPQRPLNAYNFFFQEERKRILDQGGAASLDTSTNGGKVGFTELARVVSRRWKSLGAADKAPFLRMAEQDKQRYYREMDFWYKLTNQDQHNAEEGGGGLSLGDSKPEAADSMGQQVQSPSFNLNNPTTQQQLHELQQKQQQQLQHQQLQQQLQRLQQQQLQQQLQQQQQMQLQQQQRLNNYNSNQGGPGMASTSPWTAQRDVSSSNNNNFPAWDDQDHFFESSGTTNSLSSQPQQLQPDGIVGGVKQQQQQQPVGIAPGQTEMFQQMAPNFASSSNVTQQLLQQLGITADAFNQQQQQIPEMQSNNVTTSATDRFMPISGGSSSMTSQGTNLHNIPEPGAVGGGTSLRAPLRDSRGFSAFYNKDTEFSAPSPSPHHNSHVLSDDVDLKEGNTSHQNQFISRVHTSAYQLLASKLGQDAVDFLVETFLNK